MGRSRGCARQAGDDTGHDRAGVDDEVVDAEEGLGARALSRALALPLHAIKLHKPHRRRRASRRTCDISVREDFEFCLRAQGSYLVASMTKTGGIRSCTAPATDLQSFSLANWNFLNFC